MTDRRHEIRERLAAAELDGADYGSDACDDIRWLLSRLAIATNRAERLYEVLKTTADRLVDAPCHDTNRPIERAMREALANERRR